MAQSGSTGGSRVEKKYLELPEPTAQDNLPDVTRLVSFLKAKFEKNSSMALEVPW